jgi:hypothetical protein
MRRSREFPSKNNEGWQPKIVSRFTFEPHALFFPGARAPPLRLGLLTFPSVGDADFLAVFVL